MNTTICELLKNATSTDHDLIERHPFQAALATGTIPRESYADYLGQLYFVHRALEEALGAAGRWHRPIRDFVGEQFAKTPQIALDLNHFGISIDELEPSSEVSELAFAMREAQTRSPLSLLGYLYVLEGSTNGGKYIARVLRRHLGLPPDQGTAYLDPYGDQQRARWNEFKAGLNSVAFTESDRIELVCAAREVFARLTALSDELYRRLAESRAELVGASSDSAES